MAHNDDFAFFRRKGSIAFDPPIPHLEVIVNAREIGESARLRVADALGVSLFCQFDQAQPFFVRDNQELEVELGEEPVCVSLFSDNGLVLDSKRFDPIIFVPSVQIHDLPESVPYSQESIRVRLGSSYLSELEVLFRMDQGAWTTLEVNNLNFFDLPVPKHTGLLQLTLRCRSQHAPLTQRGIAVLHREVRVRHPEAEISFSIPDRVKCHESVSACLRVNWASHVLVRSATKSRAFDSPGNNTLSYEISIPSETVGRQEIHIEVEALDGSSVVRVFPYEVYPRQSHCKIETKNDINISYDLTAGHDLTFCVSDQDGIQDLKELSGIFQCYRTVPTQARFSWKDDAGKSHSLKFLLPQVVVPKIDLPDLPQTTNYAKGRLHCCISAEDLSSVEGFYRLEGEDDWMVIPEIGTKGLSLPLPRRVCRLDLQLVGKSKHADIAPEATILYERSIRVEHPEPCLDMCFPEKIYRFDPVSANFRVNWVHRVRVESEIKDYSFDLPRNSLNTNLPISTSKVGKQSFKVFAQGLDGREFVKNFNVEILPRISTCKLQKSPDGGVSYKLKAGKTLKLHLPYRPERLLPVEGCLYPFFLSPVEASLSWEDDSGNLLSRPLVLQGQPPSIGNEVWTFPSAIGWTPPTFS